MKTYYVYILANEARVLYTGVTSDLLRRLTEHRQKLLPGYTAAKGIARLVHFAETSDVHAALEREKQVKSWTRRRRIELIEQSNPEWRDLAAEWFEAPLASRAGSGLP